MILQEHLTTATQGKLSYNNKKPGLACALDCMGARARRANCWLEDARQDGFIYSGPHDVGMPAFTVTSLFATAFVARFKLIAPVPKFLA